MSECRAWGRATVVDDSERSWPGDRARPVRRARLARRPPGGVAAAMPVCPLCQPGPAAPASAGCEAFLQRCDAAPRPPAPGQRPGTAPPEGDVSAAVTAAPRLGRKGGTTMGFVVLITW